MSDVGEPDSVLNEELAQLADEETEEEAAAAEAAQSKACQDYVTSVALQRAPSNQQEYLQLDNHTFLLPNPILAQQRAAAAGNRELASKPLDPIALRCAGLPVTSVSWHWDTLISGFWMQHQCGGSKTGQPPCPHCYDTRVEQQQQQQQEGGQQQEVQLHPVKLMKWVKGSCGTVTSHGWSQPAHRYLTLSGLEGWMLVQQYRCKGCPGVCVAQHNRLGRQRGRSVAGGSGTHLVQVATAEVTPCTTVHSMHDGAVKEQAQPICPALAEQA